MHIQPPEGKADLAQIMEGFRNAAAYIDLYYDMLPSHLIVGLTYEKLAKASQRYGFKLADEPLPAKLAARYIEFTKDETIEYDQNNPRFCFQTCSDFVAKFTPQSD